MKISSALACVAALSTLISCRPKPLDIPVPQKQGDLTISSACLNETSVYVSATYSINSLKKLLDTSALKEYGSIPTEMLVDSGLVSIRAYGKKPDTLRKISPGLYGRTDLNLTAGTQYTLTVHDRRKGTTATATTTYLPRPVIDSLYPELVRGTKDTFVRLHIRLGRVAAGTRYFISYNTPANARATGIRLPNGAGSVYTFAPKQIELLNCDNLTGGQYEKTITIQAKATDTLLVQLGCIDRSYYDYLAAYKRSGTLINQVSGEPINLPTNIITGLGYFSLYQPVRKIYDLTRM